MAKILLDQTDVINNLTTNAADKPLSAAQGVELKKQIDGLERGAPHIGDNGNWFIGDTDTGVKASGTDGKDGKDGEDGVTPHIGANGNWFIGDTDTGVAAGGVGGGSGGVSSWNDLTDKPFGEVVETIEPITWDGNTEGLLEVTPEGFDYGTRFYKVSDRIFSIEQLKSMIYSTFSDNIDYEDEEYTYLIGDELEDLISSGCITEDIFDLYGEVCIVRKPGATGISYDCTFPETGVYFFKTTTENVRVSYVTSLYIEGNSFATVKQLDNKFLEPFESIDAEDLLPSGVDQTFLHNLGVFAISSKTTEEMFWKWQEGIKGNVFVEFDGVTYECSPQRLAAMDNGMAVGNCTNFGGTGNNEPFIITILPDTDANGVATGAYYWAIVALTDTAPTEHQYRVYQPYDEPKYMLKESHLPFDAIAAYIDNYIDEALGGDY